MRSIFAALCVLMSVGVLNAANSSAQPSQEREDALFKRVFGASRFLDPALVARARGGERLSFDRNNDGKPDELWYLDTSPRHTATPLLVRVLDEDGDLGKDQRGDLDSDLYFWDWNADGRIDAVTDYLDNDHDSDVDEMGIFFDKNWGDNAAHLTVWWAVDVGDDNLLWFDVNGTYDQTLCQWRTHFSGDELFYQFRLDEGAATWTHVWEDPFAFYDPDGDQCSEEVVRISSIGDAIKNLRYSIDADDDAYGRHTHDYDFSVTAIPKEEGLGHDPACSAPLQIRNMPTLPVLTWGHAKAFSQNAAWGKAMLIWDELNTNTDGTEVGDPHERWEGLLNAASKSGSFPQVGGPPCSKLNKRMEISANPPCPLVLYFDAADRRLHMPGAREGYMDVDFDLDGKLDAAYTYTDDNNDGVFEHRAFDANGDGVIDATWSLSGKGERLPLEFKQIAPFYQQQVQRDLEESRAFVDAAETAFGKLPEDVQEVKDYFNARLAGYLPEVDAGGYLRQSPAGMRFYLDLMRDRLYVAAAKQFRKGWEKVAEEYARGNYGGAGKALLALAQPARQTGPKLWTVAGQPFPKALTVEVKNDLDVPRVETPVVLSIAELKTKAPDFNPGHCAVALSAHWVDWVEVPHQVDGFAWDDMQELSFLANVPAHGKATYFLFYAPEGSRANPFLALTRAVLDTPAYVAWESDAGAYRFYTGQFDFFGKHQSRTLPRKDQLLYPIVGQDYHSEQPWGMDALHVNKTSGLGGLTLSLAGKDYPVQSPAGVGHVQFTHRVLGAGPVRAAVEITAKNVFEDTPEQAVTFRCFAYAGHAESEIRVRWPKEREDALWVPGLLHLAEETAFADKALGLMGTWGRQGDEIGEIGLAVVVPAGQVRDAFEATDEQRMRCTGEKGGARYWILGDWRRGRAYPVAPTADNWKWETTRLARELQEDQELSLHIAKP